MTLDPKDPFLETAIARLVDRRIADSQLAVLVRQLQGRVRALTYTMATRPANPVTGHIIFVSDGGAGNVFQGWNGTSWVGLG